MRKKASVEEIVKDVMEMKVKRKMKFWMIGVDYVLIDRR